MGTLYDRIGDGYTLLRRPDARIAAAIHSHLEGCGSILNVGAGTGSYEPAGADVIAVDPSWTMIRQRPSGSAPVVMAQAEALPFADHSFDAVLATLTVHHWTDKERGLSECMRCARRRLVVFTVDTSVLRTQSWLLRDYFSEILDIDERIFPTINSFRRLPGAVTVEPVPVPADCSDGFLEAYWRRPEAYLDADVRARISGFTKIVNVDEGLQRLRADLESGLWERRNGDLRELPDFDLGYRIISVDWS